MRRLEAEEWAALFCLLMALLSFASAACPPNRNRATLAAMEGR